MMRRYCVMLLLALPMAVMAQMKFGFFSYDEALQSMRDYTLVQKKMTTLQDQYQAETKRVEEEFNRKYEEFLDGQREFPKTILQKRQTELQELLKSNVAFKAESMKLLKQAEEEAFAPLHEKLRKVLSTIGSEHGYAFILNTDGNACPYIDPEMGEDVSATVKEALR